MAKAEAFPGAGVQTEAAGQQRWGAEVSEYLENLVHLAHVDHEAISAGDV